MAGSKALRPHLGRLMRPVNAPSTSTFSPAPIQTAAFSTTAPQCHRKAREKPKELKRKTKDNNPKRGVSSLYRSGPREPLSMSGIPLPRPRDFKPKIPVDKNHGLWGFFPEPGKALWTPAETEKHGRAWAVEELRRKSWEDLHSLWWVCCRERNMLATSRRVLNKARLGFGGREIDTREEEILKTMRSIKHTLTERYYTWEDAVDVAKEDPEINWEDGEGQIFNPSAYEDEYETNPSWPVAGREAAAEPSTEAMQPGTAPVEQPLKSVLVEPEVPRTDKEATR